MTLTKSKQVVRQFEFESASNPGNYYSVLVYDDETTSCNCKGWIFSLNRSTNGKRFCKHTTEVERALQDNLARPKIPRPTMRNVQAMRSARKALQDAGQTVGVQVTVMTRQRRMFDLEDE